MYGTKRELAKYCSRATRSLALAVGALFVAAYAQPGLAGEPNQARFKSAEAASHALFLAVQERDEPAVTEILGGGKDLVSSDDEVEDQLDRERFAQKYQEMHRLVREPHGEMLLYIGAENWPFPIPLVPRDGAWRFDSDAGGQEIRYRRIGENEVTAIALCHDLIAAATHPVAADQANPFTRAVLTDAKRHEPVPLHGYYFRVLPKSGTRVSAIAYPAAYRSSGVMSFIINQDDVVREKDLGPNTASLARATAVYPADTTWTRAETP